jgi:hypothetical protein
MVLRGFQILNEGWFHISDETNRAVLFRINPVGLIVLVVQRNVVRLFQAALKIDPHNMQLLTEPSMFNQPILVE